MAQNSQIIGKLTARTKSLEAELKQARTALKGRNSSATKNWMSLSDTTLPKEEEETWFATYLDMMTLLLVLMIVMLAFAGKETRSAHAAAEAASQTATSTIVVSGTGVLPGSTSIRNESYAISDDNSILVAHTEPITTKTQNNTAQLEQMGFTELGDDIDVVLNDQSVSFRINSEILFPSGQADLSIAGSHVLKKLVLTLQKNNYQVAVEGHTDSVPIRSARFPSNWELSGSRAGSVVRYFEANGIESHRLRAIGYADTKPLQTNDTNEGRAMNRRVELTMDIPD